MQPDFWLERWRSGRIGFHQDHVTPALPAAWPALGLPAGARVLVPLCGKSLDMAWLAAQGCAVLGVELAPEAVEAFFADNGLPCERRETADGTRYRSGAIEILCADIFRVGPATLGECQGVFDRAALVALPPAMRADYCRHVYGQLAPGYRGLLISLEYPQERRQGPPFSVPDDEVRALLAGLATPELLSRRDVLEREGKFASQGVDRLETLVYRLDDARR